MAQLPEQIAAAELVLRRLGAPDAEAIHSAIEASRDHLRPFMPFASKDPADLAWRRQWIQRVEDNFEAGRSFNYGIFRVGELVGNCSIDPKSDDVASIGYWIRHDCTRRGYASTAATALRDAAVDAGFTMVLLRHDRANTASEAIARRAGFTFVKAEPHSIDAPGQTGTTLVWAYMARGQRQRP